MLSTPYITDLEVESNYTLLLTFENGEQRRFDVKPYLSTTVFAPLQDYDFSGRFGLSMDRSNGRVSGIWALIPCMLNQSPLW